MLVDVVHVALCTLANILVNTTYTNPDLTRPGINAQPCSSSPKAPILTSCTAHLAHGTILLASLRLMQNPAPPVANQKRTDFWRETAEKINGRGSNNTILPEMGMLETQL